MKKSLLLGGLVLIVFSLLVYLGTWQVQRLAWKNDLIERLHTRVKEQPISLQKALDQYYKKADVEFQPVRVQGLFHHETEKHLYTLDKKGRPGWHIYTVLELKASDCAACLNRNKYVFVNRGFVPYGLKKVKRRPKGLVSEKVDLVGLIRLPRDKKTFFEADNKPLKNEWFWPSLKEMTTPDAGIKEAMIIHLVPLFIEERKSPKNYAWPRPGVTRINLPNNHLGYVITWYGLALALLGVYGFFLYSNRRQRIEDET